MSRRRKQGGTRSEQEYPNRNRGREIVEHLRRASGGDRQMTTEEVMRLTRGEDWGTGCLEEDSMNSDSGSNLVD
jgi:hypothetical protein